MLIPYGTNYRTLSQYDGQSPFKGAHEHRFPEPGTLRDLGAQKVTSAPVPSGQTPSTGGKDLPGEVFPFQWEGIAFLCSRQAALLADEMGLGKTIQTVLAIGRLVESGQISRALLIAPKSLIPTWQRELARWAPSIRVQAISGDPHQRAWYWHFSKAAVLLAHYELLVQDHHLWPSGRAKCPVPEFDLVVLDEAQRIKNRKSRTAGIIHRIPRRRSWALTGTPLENSLEDLAGLFQFLQPGLVPRGASGATIRQVIAPYILRRTKTEVLPQLPPKIYRDRLLELTDQQRSSYHMAETEGRLRLNDLGGEVTIRHVFELLVRLKQICNFDPATGESSKLEQLLQDLEQLPTLQTKAVVFSQFVATLECLAKELRPFCPLVYHGGMLAADREKVLHQFVNGRQHRVLLISFRAGGVGLNLQVADHVFLFDRWWNPALEEQAIHRVHRIGSTSPVVITRYLVNRTIEQRIDQLLTEKRQLFSSLFSGLESAGILPIKSEEWFALLELDPPWESKTAGKVRDLAASGGVQGGVSEPADRFESRRRPAAA